MAQEKKLIQEILNRSSKNAADKLVRIYYDELYRYLYRQVGNPEDALDLTQESFIAALRSLPSFDPQKASFRTWLYRIATHKTIDSLRRFHPVTVPLTDETLLSEDDFATNISDKELLSEIEKSIRSLDPALQEIYRLRLYGGYSFPEISKITRQPEAKIKAQYYRLMQKLRKEYGNHA